MPRMAVASGSDNVPPASTDSEAPAPTDQELEKQRRMRVCVIKEIVETERTYLGNLEFVSKVRAFSPLKKRHTIHYTCTRTVGVDRRLPLSVAWTYPYDSQQLHPFFYFSLNLASLRLTISVGRLVGADLQCGRQAVEYAKSFSQ